jgi:hypothetical protein
MAGRGRAISHMAALQQCVTIEPHSKPPSCTSQVQSPSSCWRNRTEITGNRVRRSASRRNAGGTRTGSAAIRRMMPRMTTAEHWQIWRAQPGPSTRNARRRQRPCNGTSMTPSAQRFSPRAGWLRAGFGSLPEPHEGCGHAIWLGLVRGVEVVESFEHFTGEVREQSSEPRLHRLPTGMRP